MTKLLIKLYSKNKLAVIFILTLTFYSVSWLSKFNIGMYIFGTPLLFYFPGKFLIEIIPQFDFRFGKFGKFSICILYSFFSASVLGSFLQKSFGFGSGYTFWGIIMSNIILFLLLGLLPKIKLWKNLNLLKPHHHFDSYSVNWRDYIPLFIFGAAILALVFISPMAQNADGYLEMLKQSMGQRSYSSYPDQSIITFRQLFISLPALTSQFLGLDILFVFRNIFVVLFFIFTLIFYDYLKRNFHQRYIIALLYLSLLIPSVILTEINIIRPQVVILALTIPVMILSIESVKLKSLFASIITLVISIVAIKFHEMSFALTIAALLALVINIFRLTFIDKKISWKHLLLFTMIIIPYLIFLNISVLFAQPVNWLLDALSLLPEIKWHWWFISNYRTIDGADLSWTGIYSLFYYLYNGAQLIILLVVLVCLALKNKIKLKIWLLIPILYFAAFFIVAEILPRIGLYFLPNRAWVNLMIVAVIILSLLLEQMKNGQLKLKIFPIVTTILIIVGYSGTLYVTKNNIDSVYKEELPIAKFIKNSTPENSIILSSQSNATLVNIYGDRLYGQIPTSNHIINKQEFDQIIQDKLQDLSKDKIEYIQPETIQTIETRKNNQTLDKQVATLQPEKIRVSKALYSSDNPVYFLFSYRKTYGLANERVRNKVKLDIDNKEIYDKLGYPIAFTDQSSILLKIK